MAHETEHPESWRSPAGILPPLIAAVLFGLFLQAVPEISGGGTLRFALPWVPSLGTELAFLIDGLSLTFALLISGIGVPHATWPDIRSMGGSRFISRPS